MVAFGTVTIVATLVQQIMQTIGWQKENGTKNMTTRLVGVSKNEVGQFFVFGSVN